MPELETYVFYYIRGRGHARMLSYRPRSLQAANASLRPAGMESPLWAVAESGVMRLFPRPRKSGGVLINIDTDG